MSRGSRLSATSSSPRRSVGGTDGGDLAPIGSQRTRIWSSARDRHAGKITGLDSHLSRMLISPKANFGTIGRVKSFRLIATVGPENVTPPSGNKGSRPSISMVSVIIPHYDNLEGLQWCIANLRTQTLDPSRYEIIVADNNSSCGISAVKQACQGVASVVPAPIPGAAEARNAAIAVARGEVLAFTDQDCRPRPDWLERGVRALDGADVVGGRMVVCVDDRMRVTPTSSGGMCLPKSACFAPECRRTSIGAIARPRSAFACDTRPMPS
jgi:hypothetical protein